LFRNHFKYVLVFLICGCGDTLRVFQRFAKQKLHVLIRQTDWFVTLTSTLICGQFIDIYFWNFYEVFITVV